jgi:hypothetical protein
MEFSNSMSLNIDCLSLQKLMRYAVINVKTSVLVFINKKDVFNQNIAVCFKIKTDRYILLSNMLIYYILEAIINAL